METEKRKNYTRVGILLREDPEAAAKEIKAVLVQTRGNASEASRRLGVSHASLLRYFQRLREAGYPVREKGKIGRKAHEDDADFAVRTQVVREAVAVHRRSLTLHQAEILRRRFPARGKPQSCVRIAAELGISRQAVHKAEASALSRIGQAPSD